MTLVFQITSIIFLDFKIFSNLIVSSTLGDEVQVVSRRGDTTPLIASTSFHTCGFSGFRI